MSFLSWKGAKIYCTYSHITQPHMCIKKTLKCNSKNTPNLLHIDGKKNYHS